MLTISNLIHLLWFPNGKFQKFWFSSRTNKGFNNEMSSFVKHHSTSLETTDFFKSPQDAVAGIIYHDQIIRHTTADETEINAHHKKAMELAYWLLVNKHHIHSSMKPEHIVFSLLPLRHTGISEWVQFCIDYIDSLDIADPEKHFDRFIRASLRNKVNLNSNTFSLTFLNFQDYDDVLDTNFHYSYDKNFDPTETKAMRSLINYIEEYHDLEKPFVVSLSGGVDSMVCLALASRIPNLKLQAIHFNWNQRIESSRESKFLEDYCAYNKIPLFLRNITHLNRTENRSFFEEESRRIRFNGYRVLNAGSVFLGHHKGDIIENVFTNMVRGTNYLDLGKMKVRDIQDGIPICRPFLSVKKQDIYNVAKYMLIPFFKDTTPDWSNRGAIRRRIFPEMKSQFGSQYERGFIRMAEHSRQVNEMIQTSLIEPYISTIRCIKKGSYMIPLYKYPVIFYEMVFEKIFHSLGVSKPKQKAVKVWYTNMIMDSKKHMKVTLSNVASSQKCDDGNSAILKIDIMK